MKPLFGLKIMSARQWRRNMDYITRLLDESHRTREKMCYLDVEGVKLRAELERYKAHASSMGEIIEEKEQRIRKLSRRCTHLEHELEKAEHTP